MNIGLLILLVGYISWCNGLGNLSYAGHPLYVRLSPPKVNDLSMWDGIITVDVDYSLQATGRWRLRIEPDNSYMVTVDSTSDVILEPDKLIAANLNETGLNSHVNFTIHGHFLGFTKLYILVSNDSSNESYIKWKKLPFEFMVTVTRPTRIVDTVFTVAIAILVIVSNIMMGTKVDLFVVKEVLMRPYSPLIGFCTQFILMPPLAFGIGKALSLNPSQALGLFAAGCAPGGGASNMYSYLLGGDVSLSMTMTLVSTIASLGMIPLWMFTLGQIVIEDIGGMQIPYENICITLVSILIPVGIGVIIARKKPKFVKLLDKGIKPFLVILILFMSSFGVWVNLYMFQLFTPKLIGAGMLLPWVGFLIGGIIPLIFRRPRNRIITIAIETGIQNTGVPILLLMFSLPSPQGDLAIVGPVATSMFTPIPLLIAALVVTIRKRCCIQNINDDNGEKGIENGGMDNVSRKDSNNSNEFELEIKDVEIDGHSLDENDKSQKPSSEQRKLSVKSESKYSMQNDRIVAEDLERKSSVTSDADKRRSSIKRHSTISAFSAQSTASQQLNERASLGNIWLL